MSWSIPLSDLDYGAEEEQAVLEVLRSKWISMGPRTEAMEQAFAKFFGVRHAIAVTNCTAALELVLGEVLCPWDWQEVQDKQPSVGRPVVIVPDITFVATANAPYMCGARVATADIAPGSAFPGPREIQDAIERAGVQRPAAIVAVHYAGFDAGTESLTALAEHYGCPLIEDAAHAIGGYTAGGTHLGTTGLAGCFSFFANKNLSTGEGGLVATNDDRLAAAIRLRRSHGMTSLTWQRHQGRASSYDVMTAGHNLRITEITAALALVQLGRLAAGNDHRRHLWDRYVAAFTEHPLLAVPLGKGPTGAADAACHIFPLLAANTVGRDAIRARLARERIQTSHHYPAIHTFTFWSQAMADARGGSCPPRPQAAQFANRELTLPLHARLSLEDQDRVIAAVLEAVS